MNNNNEIIDVSCNIINIGFKTITPDENIFINVYNTNVQYVPQNTPISFEYCNSINGSCYFNTDTSQIFLWKTGFYHIFFNIYNIEGCQFSLFKNSIDIISGSTIGTMSGTMLNSNAVILELTDDDMIIDCSCSPCGKSATLELVNITPFIDYITLYDSSGLGYVYPQINSSITLFSLCN